MASPNISDATKKKIINQKGGGIFTKVIPVILNSILPELIEAIV